MPEAAIAKFECKAFHGTNGLHWWWMLIGPDVSIAQGAASEEQCKRDAREEAKKRNWKVNV